MELTQLLVWNPLRIICSLSLMSMDLVLNLFKVQDVRAGVHQIKHNQFLYCVIVYWKPCTRNTCEYTVKSPVTRFPWDHIQVSAYESCLPTDIVPLCSSRKYPYSSAWKVFYFALPEPPGNSSLASYFSSKNLALRPLPPSNFL